MFEKFYEPIQQDLNEVDRCIDLLSDSDFPLLKQVGLHIFGKKGKRLRPMLLIYTYYLFRKPLTEEAYRSAALIEILHTSSLVHDDVVDEADSRRGKPSVRAVWGNRAAVLSGDYLISNSFIRAFPDQTQSRLTYFLLEVIRTMCEGELLQLQYTAHSDMNEETYYHIIERKTAALFAGCCRCGAYTAGASEEEIKMAMAVGAYAGMAFQIKDDLLDISPSSSNQEGKLYGNDLKEGKLTLPTLFYLRNISASQRQCFFEWLRNPKQWKETELEQVLTCIRQSGAPAYCLEKMKSYEQLAQKALQSWGKDQPNYSDFLRWVCLG